MKAFSSLERSTTKVHQLMQHLHRSVELPFISFQQALKMTEISESCTADLPQGGKSLLFKDISKTVLIGSKVEKEILRNVSGTVLPGEMLALMGPSGSGKTSLLEILGGRSLAGVSGNVCLGGSLYQRKTMRHKVAYIMQDDIFMFSYVLTVRDHLTFAAQMKLSETLSNEQKTQKVVNVINDLGLNHCADSPLLLISGGERKRTSIGMEIISDPEILLIDEGTSGLDSTAAVSFIRLIKSIASRLSIPVVQAIHQPSTAVFYMFSAILLLSYGNVVYKGHPKSCMSYFLNLGYAPPHGASVNPADFALDLLHDDGSMESTLLDQTAICQHDGAPPRAILVENYKNIDPLSVLNEMEHQVSNTKDITAKNDTDLNKIESIIKNISGRYPSYYSTQFLGLFSRSFRSARSSRFGFLNFAETIILALLVGACWFQTPSTENRLVDLTGYLFLSMLYWFFIGLFQGLLEFLPERVCLRKEREAGMYHLSAYFLAKTFASAPSRIVLPSLYLLISYPMAVENPQASALFGVCAIVILVTLVGESLGLLVGTLTVKEDVAISVATLVALGMMLMGGFYVSTTRIPYFLVWLKYTSAFLYGYQSIVKVQVLYGGDIRCEEGFKIYACGGRFNQYLRKEETLAWLALQDMTLGSQIGILLLLFFMLRFAAYFALRFAPYNSGRN